MKRMILLVAVVGMVCGGAWAEVDWVKASEKVGEHDDRFWDIEFQGGSLIDYYSGLQGAIEGVNVIHSEDAATVLMPAVTLNGVYARTLIQLPPRLLRGISVQQGGAGLTRRNEQGEHERYGDDPFWLINVDPSEVTSWMPSQPDSTQGHGYNISFPGGSVAEYVATVREAAGGKMNVVMMPGVEGVMVPEISLRGVRADDAMGVLSELRRPDGESWAYVKRVGQVYVLRPGSDAGREITREVWNLSYLLSTGIGEEGILRAVEMGLGSVGDGAEVLYHEDTGLLLVVGTHGHVIVVGEILEKMRETAEVREHERRMEEERVRQREELELDIQRMQAEIELHQQQIHLQHEEVAELEKLAAEEMVSGQDVRRSRMELQHFEAELQIKVREMQILERRQKAADEGGKEMGA